jgi:Holliday junction DNA helicase RuvA
VISSVSGDIAERGENWVLVETASGVGYRVYTSRRGLDVGAGRVRFHTHLIVREDLMALYGFPEAEEVRMFELLIKVDGVGPKHALSILNLGKLPDIVRAIRGSDLNFVSQASGIGKKTAGKIILMLRDRFSGNADDSVPGEDAPPSALKDALQSLGYTEMQIAQLVKSIPADAPVEEQIRLALKQAAGRPR